MQNNMLFEEIIEKLKLICSIRQFAHFYGIPFILKEGSTKYENFKYGNDTYYKIEGLGLCKQVVPEYRENDEWYSIAYFPEYDVYIKTTGFYNEYNAIEFKGWESCKEVRPKEIITTIYEPCN